MPKRGVRDVLHTSYTDHRIQRPGSRLPAGDKHLRPWRIHPLDGERSLALALFEWGVATRDVASIQTAFAKLVDLPPEQQKNDPAVLSAMGVIALQKGRAREAATWLRSAAELKPGAEAEMQVARAEEAAGAPGHRIEALRGGYPHRSDFS
jgi:predicted Zn-dependent protease